MAPERTPLEQALLLVADRQALSRDAARDAVLEIMAGKASAAQIGAFLLGLRVKGETAEELTGAALAMRSFATQVRTSRQPILDTCGTGGDGRATWNISTAVALVAAGAGVAVAKHGNRSVSSRSGSADVLEAAGVNVELTPEEMGRCLDEVGFAFLYAPTLHGAMRHAAAPRRELKVRTLFNLLGPLTNPAGAGHQLLGVFDAERARLISAALAGLGTTRTWVVHGTDGHDELSIAAPSIAVEVMGASCIESVVRPEDAGLSRSDRPGLEGGSPAENAAWLQGMLSAELDGPSRDMVLLNTAAALHVVGRVGDLKQGVEMARASIESGSALRVLDHLRSFTQGA